MEMNADSVALVSSVLYMRQAFIVKRFIIHLSGPGVVYS